MGLIEVIPKIFKINRIIKSVVNQIIELDPDIIFTVDSPDFTLRIAKRIKKRNNKLKILHYVALRLGMEAWTCPYSKKISRSLAQFYPLRRKYLRNMKCRQLL